MTETTVSITCTAPHCRYCRAAADYMELPIGDPRVCQAAKIADQVGELAAFAYLRSLARITTIV